MAFMTELSRITIVIGLHMTDDIKNFNAQQVHNLLEKKGFVMSNSFDNDTWRWYTHEKFNGNFQTTQVCFNLQDAVQDILFFQFGQQ